MKKHFLTAALLNLMAAAAMAQTAATPAAAATAASKAPITAVCKDGTPYSGETLKGACRGHGGVDKNAAQGAKSAAPVAAKETPAAPAITAAAAAGGGAGKVWVNSSTKVYHCSGDRWYGKTKAGEYMNEADAKAKGIKADHGLTCASK